MRELDVVWLVCPSCGQGDHMVEFDQVVHDRPTTDTAYINCPTRFGVFIQRGQSAGTALPSRG